MGKLTVAKNNQMFTREKALNLNLDGTIYGTIAEIGAGQETARHFFRAGGASGTIAKTMSAYDMAFSDAIYGKEDSGRYVCESRLHKMLKREYNLLTERLSDKRGDKTRFFSLANTVAVTPFNSTRPGHGWVGMTYQLRVNGPVNTVVIHVNLKEPDSQRQQTEIGVIGVNLAYACFHYHSDPEKFVNTLVDGVSKKDVEVDMIRTFGDDLAHLDQRLLGLLLVKNNLTQAVIINPDGVVLQPSDVLYKKNTFVVRGSFRPPTHVNLDMINSGLEQFLQEDGVDEVNTVTICEITLNNLKSQADLDENDFLSRVEILSALGKTVLLSNLQEYYKLSVFLSGHTRGKIGFGIGTPGLKEIFDEKYYDDLPGGILEAFGHLLARDLKLYVYPMKKNDNSYEDTKNLELPQKLQHLYSFIQFNGFIADYQKVNREIHDIYSKDVIEKILTGISGWEENVPSEVAKIIKDKNLFNPMKIKKAQ